MNRRSLVKGSLAMAVGAGVSGIAFRNLFAGSIPAQVGNPILPGKGVCDPQIRIFEDRVYLYATHDASEKNTFWKMNDWWVWRSDDLVNWEQVSTLRPEETFLRKPFSDCWATDAATRGGRYFFYFSAGPRQIGVVTGDTPAGPWHDPLGKPLIPEGLTPTEARDPGILMDDDGANYVIFGVYTYYIARLNDDMISLAEIPRAVEIDHSFGPYGEGKTDDKPFLHKRAGKYYLSWGCFYAMSESPYGPYSYKGSIITMEQTAQEFQRVPSLLLDRHGSFFEFRGQWYFACNDVSLPGCTPYFRNTVLSYVHYRENGEIAPVRIDRVGVGRYDASAGRVEAEDFFELKRGSVRERPGGSFEVAGLSNGSSLRYPDVANVPRVSSLMVRISNASGKKSSLEVYAGGANGKPAATVKIPPTRSWDEYIEVEVPLTGASSKLDLKLEVRGEPGEIARLDSWRIVERKGASSKP